MQTRTRIWTHARTHASARAKSPGIPFSRFHSLVECAAAMHRRCESHGGGEATRKGKGRRGGREPSAGMRRSESATSWWWCWDRPGPSRAGPSKGSAIGRPKRPDSRDPQASVSFEAVHTTEKTPPAAAACSSGNRGTKSLRGGERGGREDGRGGGERGVRARRRIAP